NRSACHQASKDVPILEHSCPTERTPGLGETPGTAIGAPVCAPTAAYRVRTSDAHSDAEARLALRSTPRRVSSQSQSDAAYSVSRSRNAFGRSTGAQALRVQLHLAVVRRPPHSQSRQQ